MTDEPLRGYVFGDWDAPSTDDDIPIATPVGEACIFCGEKIQDGDNGRITPRWRWGGRDVGGQVVHRECTMRAVMGGVGHHVDHERYCVEMGDQDAGLSWRASAILVWNLWQMTTGRLSLASQFRESLDLLRGDFNGAPPDKEAA